MSTFTPVKIYHGYPGIIASPTTAYTVPTGKKLILKHIRITNTTSNSATFTMITGSNINTVPQPFFANGLPVKANDVVIFEISEVLEAGEQIVLSQAVAATLHVQLSGVELAI